MFWLSLLVLMLIVAAAPGISMYLESRRQTVVGAEAGDSRSE